MIISPRVEPANEFYDGDKDNDKENDGYLDVWRLWWTTLHSAHAGRLVVIGTLSHPAV